MSIIQVNISSKQNNATTLEHRYVKTGLKVFAIATHKKKGLTGISPAQHRGCCSSILSIKWNGWKQFPSILYFGNFHMLDKVRFCHKKSLKTSFAWHSSNCLLNKVTDCDISMSCTGIKVCSVLHVLVWKPLWTFKLINAFSYLACRKRSVLL